MLSSMKHRRLLALPLALGLAACADDPVDPAPAGLFFPTKPYGDGSVATALSDGKLAVRDECVLVSGPGAGQYSLPIWWDDFTAERDDAGRLVVRDGDRAAVAIEGQPFAMGGGYVAEFEPEGLVEPREMQVRRIEEGLGHSIPDRCLGADVYGIWEVGETSPL
jgi:hypothetical protein